MDKGRIKNLKTGMGVFFVVVLLLGIALGFKFYNPQEDAVEKNREVALSAEETKMQIAMEIRDDQLEVDNAFEITASEIQQAEEEKDEKALQKIYYIRVNNTDTVNLLMNAKIHPIGSAAKDDPTFLEFLNRVKVRIYNSTDDVNLYEGTLYDLQEQTIDLEMEATAAKKNDTRFRIYFYFGDEPEAKYQDCGAQITVGWSVPSEQIGALKGAQMPNLMIIVYAFVFALVVVLLGYFGMRKFINQDYLSEKAEEFVDEPQDDEELMRK